MSTVPNMSAKEVSVREMIKTIFASLSELRDLKVPGTNRES